MSFKKMIWKYRHFLLLLLFIPNQMFFAYAEKTVKPVYFMFSVIDTHISFVKQFIIPYLFWYVYMIGTFIYLGFVSRRDFCRLFAFIMGGMTISCIIYILFPNGQNLRPVIANASDVYLKLIKDIYTVDTPTNVAPSMHVLNSIAVHAAVVNYKPLGKKWWVNISSFICMVLISASTVFVKQHSILDVMWACVLSFVLYTLIYVVPWLRASKDASVREDKSLVAS